MTSCQLGTGEWVGRAEVYDGDGSLAGYGRDTRTVTAHDDGTTTVEVSFEGPFVLAGKYTIAPVDGQRRYLGPVNLGVAESLNEHLVEAHNYWPDLGLTQRFLLAMTPDGDTQLSLALLSRGEGLSWIVVGESRRPDAAAPLVPEADALLRPGSWRGEMPSGPYVEEVDVAGGRLLGTPAGDVELSWAYDQHHLWTTGADPDVLAGSATLVGGRALSGTFVLPGQGLRLWRREVASSDGRRKAVLHRWYRGAEPVAVVAGTVEFHSG